MFFELPMNRMLVHHRVTPNIKCTGSDLYNWVERSSVRVKCFAHEHYAMSLAGGEDLESNVPTKAAPHKLQRHSKLLIQKQI